MQRANRDPKIAITRAEQEADKAQPAKSKEQRPVKHPLEDAPTHDRKGRQRDVMWRARQFQGKEQLVCAIMLTIGLIGYVAYHFAVEPDMVMYKGELVNNVRATWLGFAIVLAAFTFSFLTLKFGDRRLLFLAAIAAIPASAYGTPFIMAIYLAAAWVYMFKYSTTKRILRMSGEWPQFRRKPNATGNEDNSRTSPQSKGLPAARKSAPSKRYTPPKPSSSRRK